MNNIEFFSENSLENEVNDLMELIEEVPINKLLGHTFYKLTTSKKLAKTEASATEFRSLNLKEKKEFQIKKYNTKFVNIIDINKVTLGSKLPKMEISNVNSFMNVVHIGNFKAPQEKIPIKILLGNDKSSKLPIHDIIFKKIIDAKKGKYIYLTKPSDIKINKSDPTEIVILENFPSKSKITIESPNPLTIIAINSKVEINYVINNLNNFLYYGKCGKRVKSETPKSETPKSETPKSETPKSETPKSETPKSESDFIISGIKQEQIAVVKSKVESVQENVNKVKSEIKVMNESPKPTCPICPTLSCPKQEKCSGCPECPKCPVCEKCKYEEAIKTIKPKVEEKITKGVKAIKYELDKVEKQPIKSNPKPKNTWIIILLVLFIVAGTFGYIYWSYKNKESKNLNQSKWSAF